MTVISYRPFHFPADHLRVHLARPGIREYIRHHIDKQRFVNMSSLLFEGIDNNGGQYSLVPQR